MLAPIADVRARLPVLSFFFQAEYGIRARVRSRGLGDVYKRQGLRRAPSPRALGRQCSASGHQATGSALTPEGKRAMKITNVEVSVLEEIAFPTPISPAWQPSGTWRGVSSVSYTHLTLPTIYSV